MGWKDGFCCEEVGEELGKIPHFDQLENESVSSCKADCLFSCHSLYLSFGLFINAYFSGLFFFFLMSFSLASDGESRGRSRGH